jgi:hypothetical protein
MFSSRDPNTWSGPELRRLRARGARTPQQFANDEAAAEARRARRRAFVRRLLRRS